MGPRAGRAAAAATLAALVIASSLLGVSPAVGAEPVDELVAPVPVASATGGYIVLLDEAPAATYEGGEPGLPATRPDEGTKLDTHAPSVKEYTAFLEERQRAVAADAGVEASASYQIVLNGFSATMTPDTAARVAATEGVRAVYPDEILRPDAAPEDDETAETGDADETDDSTDVVEPEDPSEPSPPAERNKRSPVDDRPGPGADGTGVVVGLIDTGIAPGNPSFAGERVRVLKGADPYLRANTIVFDKADGRQFRSDRHTGDDWERSDYSTKLIGAQYFAAGATAAGFRFDFDTLSPRDADGHGSHSASIAAGVADVAVSVDGVELGAISGVAPQARIASYKACFAGPDPTVTTDDVCLSSDVISALDRAVADGVDVIGYSIGGGADASDWSADDIALHNAAVAGVFIAVSAGNAGPGPSTARAGAPWYTSVAASAVETLQGTVSLSTGFEAPGVTVTVPDGTTVSAPVVSAGDAGLAGSTEARLCYPGTLDPAAVGGRIVVCDRGTNPREEKSQEVADAGGVGMILVNPTPDSVDADLHAVPTVHLDAAYRADLLAAIESDPDVEATLEGESSDDAAIPSPQIAPFSGRGPDADRAEVLSPDVAAPGVSILAAAQDEPDGEPSWAFASGTSMAAPYVAGLAARYLTAHPQALPAEIKSALSTTATDTVTADGSANLDPFAQGAGAVDPAGLLDPGLLYLSGADDWAGFAEEALAGEGRSGADRNSPAIVVGGLANEKTVTRTVTAARAGTYDASASIPGIGVEVSPATLTFAAAGEMQQYTTTFTVESAPVGEWATGLLTWRSDDGTSVRSPLAVRPVAADADSLVTGHGAEGSAEVSVTPGFTGQLPATVSELAPVQLLADPRVSVPGHSGDASSGDENGNVAWMVQIPEDSPLAEFTLDASDDSELDLTVYRLTDPGEQQYDRRWASPGSSEQTRITLVDPTAGSYLLVADVGDAAEGSTWDAWAAVVGSGGGIASDAAPLTLDRESLSARAGEATRYTLSWSGLQDETQYVGVVSYGDSGERTIVRVDAGSPPPVSDEPPTIDGSARVGEVLTADPGAWTPQDVTLSYRWLRDGEPVRGAIAADYRVRATDVGTTLAVEVTAEEAGNLNRGRARSEGVLVPVGSVVEASLNRYAGTQDERFAVTVDVQTSAGAAASGTVRVSVDGTEYVGTLADGQVTFELPAQTAGIHVVVVEYGGSDGVDGSTAVAGFVVRE